MDFVLPEIWLDRTKCHDLVSRFIECNDIYSLQPGKREGSSTCLRIAIPRAWKVRGAYLRALRWRSLAFFFRPMTVFATAQWSIISFSRLSPSERVNCSLEVSPAKQELFKKEVPGEYHGRFHGGRFGFSAGRLPRACS